MKKTHRKKTDLESDLNLVPMLDLFLSLIPFLLMSTVLATFGGISVEAPKVTQAASAETSSNNSQEMNKKEIDVAVLVEAGEIKLAVYEKGFVNRMNEQDAKFSLQDVSAFKKHIEVLKTQFAHINSSLFRAAPDTRYEEAVAVLNALRSTDLSKALVLAVGAVK